MNSKIYTSILIVLLAIIALLLLKPSGEQQTVIIEKSTFQYEQPSNTSRGQALQALIDAEDTIQDLNDYGLATARLRDLLLQAQRHYIGFDRFGLQEDLVLYENDKVKKDYIFTLQNIAEKTPREEIVSIDYEQVFRITQQINFFQKKTYMLIDTIPLVEAKEKSYSQKEVNTRDATTFLQQAREAFQAERYEKAEDILINADTALDKAYSQSQQANALINVGKNFFVRYWWQIILVVVLLIIFTPKITTALQKTLAQRKLQESRLELKSLNQLIIEAQRECFEKRTITTSMYNIRVDRYRKRIADISSLIPVYEDQVGEKKEEYKEKTKHQKKERSHQKNTRKTKKRKKNLRLYNKK